MLNNRPMQSTDATTAPAPAPTPKSTSTLAPSYPTAWAAPVAPAALRGLCTDCDISRSSETKRCGEACQFI